MEDVGHAFWTIISGEGGDHTGVQLFDPFCGLVKAIAKGNGEIGKPDVCFIAFRALLKGLLMLGNLLFEVFDFLHKGTIGVFVGKVFDLKGIGKLLGNGVEVVHVHIGEPL